MREEEIGKGQVYDEEKFGYVFAEARFTKGEKEIGEAYFGKKNLLFINREFKLPFFGTFK